MSKVNGRPRKTFDWELLDSICELGLSLIDTCELLKISESTLLRRIKAKYNCTFEEYREKKKCKIRQKLVQKAFQMALAGDKTMLIFCLKNICGWSDNPRELRDLKDSVDRLVIRYGEEKIV